MIGPNRQVPLRPFLLSFRLSASCIHSEGCEHFCWGKPVGLDIEG